jgi:hypothetical protein
VDEPRDRVNEIDIHLIRENDSSVLALPKWFFIVPFWVSGRRLMQVRGQPTLILAICSAYLVRRLLVVPFAAFASAKRFVKELAHWWLGLGIEGALPRTAG